MEFLMRPIGVIHTPFTEKADTPVQASRSKAKGSIEIFPESADGLKDIEGLSHIFLWYVFHASEGYSLVDKPFLDDRKHGLFSTRYPYWPNPIGLSLVQLMGRNGNTLEIEGVDMLDGIPLLDIKPYVPEFDEGTPVRTGWYATRSEKS
jgi:tRNA-Thr(GGU) m(6)t(6)A37 methyltransferase TsaA